MAYIYAITNKLNGKQYVGTTKFSLKKRFKQHCSDSKRCDYDYGKRPMYVDMKKYGLDNFIIEELEECSDDDRFIREQYWIDKLDTYHNGYNSTYGGVGLPKYNYKKIAEKYKEVQNQKEVAKLLNCDIYTVKIACEECGVEIISAHQVQRKLYGHKVLMIDKNTDKVIQTFECVEDAYKYLNKQASGHIASVCKGERKTAYGYKWRYVEDEYISDEFENKAI